MPGACRTQSLACEMKNHDELVTPGTTPSTGIPCAMVLTVSFVLSPVTGLFCHRRRRNCFRQLDASVRGVRTTRLRRPPWCHSSTTPPRPSHPAPNVRDDRDTSLLWGETAESVEVICPTGQAKYFLPEGWTRILQNCPSGKSVDPFLPDVQTVREIVKQSDFFAHFNNRDRCSSAWRLFGRLPR